MTRADIDEWNADLEALFARLDEVFYRAESRQHARQYVRGLLAPLERKNGWTIAEHAGEADPAAMQRLLNLSPWNAEEVLALNREYAVGALGDPGAVLVADPTGFAKKGGKSVGVQRQYSGTLGRVDNCQIATFLAYVTPERDRVLIDRRLYLPEQSWIADPGRCAAAGVPPEVGFATRPEHVIEMLDTAATAGVPFAWFTADEEFGQNPGLCQYLHTSQIPYVMAVPRTTRVTDTRGRTAAIEQLAARLDHRAYARRACGIGVKGPRVYDWAVIDTDHRDHQYLIRRSISSGELAYYHCYNPDHAAVGDLVAVAGARWPIEECFGSAKNEVGLDNYQVRTWNAWHRHITLAMLAHTFLAVTARNAKKRGAKTPTPSASPTSLTANSRAKRTRQRSTSD